MVPKFCLNPHASDAAIPIAILTCWKFSFNNHAAAAAAPRLPNVDVLCHPCT
jgi:hypothetical protein